ncbi:MAG TPA: hypothetical protein VHE37_14515, partial [Nevskiaceae bacterium]|nr:hypothetical protein [Nevskiaceae bacterium]
NKINTLISNIRIAGAVGGAAGLKNINRTFSAPAQPDPPTGRSLSVDRFNEGVLVRCPHCQATAERTVRWFFQNPSCAGCGHDLTLAVERALDDAGNASRWPLVEPGCAAGS